LLGVGDVFFRTLNANGTPSTARARPEDWRDILEICFENREADIGRFLRRHLSPPGLQAMLGMVSPPQNPPPPSLHQRATDLLCEGERRFDNALAARSLTTDERQLIDNISWSVALIVDPERPNAIADRPFLTASVSSNPNLLSWPVWIDSRLFVDEANRPRVIDGGYESL